MMSAAADDTTERAAPVAIGDHCARSLRFSIADIKAFAQVSGDSNPLHHDSDVALNSRHRRIIASGQQTSSQLVGLASSHFSAAGPGGNEVLCLNFNFSFKAPVFADMAIDLAWTVTAVEWRESLSGWITQIEGGARSGETPCVVARGTLLLKERAAS